MKFEISDFEHELKDYIDRYPDEFTEIQRLEFNKKFKEK